MSGHEHFKMVLLLVGLVTFCLNIWQVESTSMVGSTSQDDEYASSMQLNADYLGCYIDSSVRDLNGSQTVLTSTNSIENCATLCWKQNFSYSGLQYS